MHLLYSDTDLAEICAQKKRRTIAVLPFLLLTLAACVTGYCLRSKWLAVIGICLFAVVFIFWFNFLFKPVANYEKLIRSALSGRYHDVSCTFSRIDPDDSLIDGIRFRPVIILGEADKHGICEHQFYLDALKEFPDIGSGTPVTLRYNDRNIIGYQF